jgi:hypothetical protein
MKTHKFFRFLTLAMCAVTFAFVTGCEGPEGPQGPAGTNGTDGTNGTNGTNGTDGTDGVDGNVTCLECHSADNPQAKLEEFHRSAHASGAIAVDYAGGRASCAKCHSHEGYLEFARTGTVAEDITNPSAWKCKTCHNIHTTFEQADYAFRLGDDVTLVSGNVIAGGNNNTCINCHQSRRDYASYVVAEDKTYTRKFTGDAIEMYTMAAVGPAGSITLNGAGDTLTVVFDVPGATHVYINSEHAGPHHGPQGDLWAGENGSVPGTAYGAHSDGCVKCHMGPESGHSFIPKEANCTVTDCHGSSKEPALKAFEARIKAVGLALADLHAVHYDEAAEKADGLFFAFHPMYASLTSAQMQAWWDFTFLLEDRSKSAHNPAYAEALLSSAEATLGL